MKPVAIFRHAANEGPGYFATFLEQHSITWQLIAVDTGAHVPADAENFSGICLMGGPMSVNDPLPWIDDTCDLIRDAVSRNVPVIGHCLGGQLLSKALGGQITRNPVKEIGWSLVHGEDSPAARQWLGKTVAATVFQWHGETFSLPEGAQRLFGNACCANQMFVLGKHLAMQCHVEMTPEMIDAWCTAWENEVRGKRPLPPSIQTPAQMRAETPARLAAMRQLAERLYGQWIKGLSSAP